MLDLFKQKGAVLEGHFLLSSGLHSSHYIQCARMFEDPKIAEQITKALVAQLPPEARQIDWVIGPAMGGILFAYELARHLKAQNAFTERDNGKMILRRGFSVPPHSRILIAEDVLTTGGSSLEVAQVLESLQAKIIGVAALVDRGTARLPYPTHALLKLQLANMKPEECALCKQGKPLVKPGSRRSSDSQGIKKTPIEKPKA